MIGFEFFREQDVEPSPIPGFPDIIHTFRVEYSNSFSPVYAASIVRELSSDDERAELLRVVTHLKQELEASR